MKLVIQIPAWEEEAHIGATVRELPRTIFGFTSVEVLVIDDGSSDLTAERAREAGADHVLRLPVHQGLAMAWRAGLDACVRLGADVIVSTDADNQYEAQDIEALVMPILRGEAEYVVGDRNVGAKEDFSPVKRLTQKFGSWVVRRASGTTVPDATSGFRALTREAALKLNVFSRMTYTIETLIQAGNKEMAVAAVRVRTHAAIRPSRLFGSAWHYVAVQGANILRMTALYKPLPVLFGLSTLLAALGLVLFLRYGYFAIAEGDLGGHIPTLLLAAIFLLAAVTSFLTGILADLISINRTLLEDVLLRLKKRDAETVGRQTGQHR